MELKQYHVKREPNGTLDYITNAGMKQGRWGLGSTSSVSIEHTNIPSKVNRCIIPITKNSKEVYVAGVCTTNTVALVTNNNEVVPVKSITNWINYGKLKIK